MSDHLGGPSPAGMLPEREARVVPVLLLTLLGVTLEAVVLWNLLAELDRLAVAGPPLLAATLGTLLSGTVCYASYRQLGDDVSVATRWRVTTGAVVGAATFLLVFGVTIVVRLLEGRTIAEPQFALYTAAGAGAVAGIIVGALYSQARQDAREAERARDETETALEEARRTRDRLELVNAILRHDIANDVLVIRSRAEAVAERAGAELASHAEAIRAQVATIEDQLERTRVILDAVGADTERTLEPMSLSTALREEATSLRNAHPEASVSVDVPEDVRIRADDLLPDVLDNVLSNAVVHNDRETPQVDVSVSVDDGTVACRVADNGPGVPDDEKRAVLEEGYSGRDDGEHGFGLFFVRTMLDAYDGSVRIEDADPRGAVFVLTFRRA